MNLLRLRKWVCNLRKKKWLLCCSHSAHKNQVSNYIKGIWRNIDAFASNCNNLIRLGDLSIEPTEKRVIYFFVIYSCKNMIRDKICCKNPENSKCIDVIMRNMPKYLKFTSNWDRVIWFSQDVLKVFYTKQEPHIIQYQSHKKVSNEALINDLRNAFFSIHF